MITHQSILELVNKAQNPSISIYLPTHKKGEETQQDPIRFKNLLRDAEAQLKEHECSSTEAENLLAEARKLLDQPSFWLYNDHGLAVFITQDTFQYYRLPYSVKENIMVEDHFLITPLIPMVTLQGTYSTLALSQKEIRLLQCTRNSVAPIMLEDTPTSLEQFLQYDEKNERHLQHYTSQGTGQAVFHGQGGIKETDRQEIINFLKTVENEVTSIMRKRNDPLVLIGIEQPVAEYRKVNHYSRLMEDAIIENPDPLSDKEIKDRSWKVIQSYFLEDMYTDIKRYGDLTGSEKQSGNLSQIVEASYYGKVDSLFVPIGEHSWGWFDQERDTIHHSAKQQNGEHDLINMAAIKTLSQGGRVYALEKEEMPQGASVAAIFRYA